MTEENYEAKAALVEIEVMVGLYFVARRKRLSKLNSLLTPQYKDCVRKSL